MLPIDIWYKISKILFDENLEKICISSHYSSLAMVGMIIEDILKDLSIGRMRFEGKLKALTMARRRFHVVTHHLILPSRLLKIIRTR